MQWNWQKIFLIEKGEDLRVKLAEFLNTLLETVVENASQLSTGDLKQIFL